MRRRRETRPEAEQPIPGLASLRDTKPPPSLVPGVMRRIAEPAPLSWWDWLRKPRRLELRMSLLGAAGVVTAGALALVLVSGGWPAHHAGPSLMVNVPGPSADQAAPAVVVRFTLVAAGARTVAVAGDFNGWDPQGTSLVDQDGRGTFAGSVRLSPGAHEYMFVVDGQWVTDPAASERRPDGFGRTNAVLRL
jgi:hypothetical protein